MLTHIQPMYQCLIHLYGHLITAFWKFFWKIWGIFVQPRILASIQPAYVRQLLIKNTITADEPECKKSCCNHRWKACRHINTSTKVFSYHKTVKPGNYSCDSANVECLIQCKKCPEARYIGETGGSFIYRFNNHTQTIRQKNLLPLPLHFNGEYHNINDLKVCILMYNFNDTKRRKLKKLQFIINFKTNNFVFNNDISLLSKYDAHKHQV